MNQKSKKKRERGEPGPTNEQKEFCHQIKL